MAQAAVVKTCDICDTEEGVSWFCVSCQETLCENCRSNHLRGRRTKNDNIIPLKEAGDIRATPVIFCEQHTSDDVSLYCAQCATLICVKCLTQNHKDHQWISYEEYIGSSADELKREQSKLAEKLSMCQEALVIEGQYHESYMIDIDGVEAEIKDTKFKVLADIKKTYDGQLDHLASLRKGEHHRYTNECIALQSQHSTIQALLKKAGQSIDNGDVRGMKQITHDVMATIQSVVEHSHPVLNAPRFQKGEINQQNILKLTGNLYLDDGNADQKDVPGIGDTTSYPHFKKIIDNIQKTKLKQTEKIPGTEDERQESKHERDNHERQKLTKSEQQHQHSGKVIESMFIKSTIHVKDMNSDIITKAVSRKDGKMWVFHPLDGFLTLLNKDGSVLKHSTKIDGRIEDILMFGNSIVAIHHGEVIRFSSDGSSVSMFISVKPYALQAMCISQNQELLLFGEHKDSKIFRLGMDGSVLQTITCDKSLLNKQIYSMATSEKGDVMVFVNKSEHKVVALDRNGRILCTWDGKTGGFKTTCFRPNQIVHDSSNNFLFTDYFSNHIYFLELNRKDICKSVAKKGLSTIVGPWGLTMTSHGHLLVACYGKKIHTVKIVY